VSHDATNWAVKVRGITPAAKIVLWHLADRHNRDTGRCDPSQDRLASDCEISRSSLNNQLLSLEKLGFISREKRIDSSTKRQKSTFYILNFDVTTPQHIATRVQNLDTEAVSKYDADPCPNMTPTRVQNLDTNLVREPGREPTTLTRLIGGDEVRDRIISILSKKYLDCSTAPAFHSSVEAALILGGMKVSREYPVDDRGDGREGRVDLVVTCDTGEMVGVECDRASPRAKSIKKLKQLDYGVIALRDSGAGTDILEGIYISHCGDGSSVSRENITRFGVSDSVLRKLEGMSREV